jgi:citryl-CoA lyase
MPSDTSWSTAVGRVGDGLIEVRGFEISDIIRRLTFSEAIFLTVRGELPSTKMTRVMDAALCSILEHGFYTPTTLASRMVTSASPRTIMPGLAAGFLTVGEVTVSPQHSAELIERVLASASGGKTLEEAARDESDRLTAAGRRMPGVGHPLHPEGDPRAIALLQIAADNGYHTEITEAFDQVRAVFTERIGRPLPTNVDGALGCVLKELGFAPIEMPGIAAMSFLPGMIAHSAEESRMRPPRIRIADGEYSGPAPRQIENGS